MISRRALFEKSARVLAGSALLPPGLPGAEPEHAAFPPGNYTPYGYLDNPYHCWDLHRSGVIRSAAGVGFGFLYPAGPGGYFDFEKNNIYEAYLRLGFRIGDRLYWEPADFGSDLVSIHHSKDLFVYRFARGESNVTAEFVQVAEDAIAARVTPSEGLGAVRVFAAGLYRLGGSSWWGRDGLSAEYQAKDDCMVARSFAAGPAFAILADRPAKAHYAGANLSAWLDTPRDVTQAVTYYPQPLECALAFDIPPGQSTVVVLARSENKGAVLSQARHARAQTPGAIAAKRDSDRKFWSGAPRLEGDWPEHWKHGWVYDFETLRMMVRRPIGVYKHPWDAMQIQAPRNVLAETSIDMWALSYADPATAKSAFLGQFLDALADNVPCMREDGVMNMVAVDGSECGTSISWCYPFFSAASIFDRTRDTAWLRELYPRLARLLRWTAANRKDAAGFLIGKCSWETGMDASKRFLIEQPTGGELTEFVRLVELQAAAAQAGAMMARFARVVGDAASVPEWQRFEQTYTAKTQELWKEDWFFDGDARSGALVTNVGRDAAQSAPAFCGAATAEQKVRMVATLRQLYEDSKRRGKESATGWDDGLNWSSIMLPYLESLWAVGQDALLSEAVATIAERIYPTMDRRSVEPPDSGSKRPKLGWPGVSCEIWGSHGAFGGEGYGWGAVLPAHIIRGVIGFREAPEQDRFWMCPNLPDLLAAKGRVYEIRGLNYLAGRLDLKLTMLDEHRLKVHGTWSDGNVLSVSGSDRHPITLERSGRSWEFEGENHQRYSVRISQPQSPRRRP